MIRNGQRIFVDAGSTTRIMLNYLDEETRAVVVVNHLKVAEQALQFANLSVIMLGGDMIRITNCSSGSCCGGAAEKISAGHCLYRSSGNRYGWKAV